MFLFSYNKIINEEILLNIFKFYMRDPDIFNNFKQCLFFSQFVVKDSFSFNRK